MTKNKYTLETSEKYNSVRIYLFNLLFADFPPRPYLTYEQRLENAKDVLKAIRKAELNHIRYFDELAVSDKNATVEYYKKEG